MPGDWIPGAPIQLYGGQFQNFQLLLDIVGSLSIPTIEPVLIDLREPCTLGLILQMADSEVLFDDVSYHGDLLVAFDFQIREFCRG